VLGNRRRERAKRSGKKVVRGGERIWAGKKESVGSLIEGKVQNKGFGEQLDFLRNEIKGGGEGLIGRKFAEGMAVTWGKRGHRAGEDLTERAVGFERGTCTKVPGNLSACLLARAIGG